MAVGTDVHGLRELVQVGDDANALVRGQVPNVQRFLSLAGQPAAQSGELRLRGAPQRFQTFGGHQCASRPARQSQT